MLAAASVPGDANNTFCMQKGDEAKAILTIGDATTNAPDTKGETIGTTVCQPKIP